MHGRLAPKASRGAGFRVFTPSEPFSESCNTKRGDPRWHWFYAVLHFVTRVFVGFRFCAAQIDR